MSAQLLFKQHQIITVTHKSSDTSDQKDDVLALEEPMEIVIEQEQPTGIEKESVYVTMRTPGNDFDLAIGFLFSEGYIQSASDVLNVAHCGPKTAPYDIHNIVKVTLAAGVPWRNLRSKRNTQGNSSCGLCGITSLKAVKIGIEDLTARWQIDSLAISALEPVISQHQPMFNQTGGIHAVSLFDNKGNWLRTMEDVGRHNAMDKIIGASLMAGALPLDQHIIVTTSRASFELVQKSARAGCNLLCAVSAPSSLAVQLAEEVGQTLVGFLRPGRFNLYHNPYERIILPSPQ